ncbi:MAG: hypothetical protein CSB32_00775, partial [Desulfobacterales bacterium]
KRDEKTRICRKTFFLNSGYNTSPPLVNTCHLETTDTYQIFTKRLTRLLSNNIWEATPDIS